jgi:ABC-2 type transport system permease protein
VKLREIFRYEIGYQRRNPATWIYAVLLFFGPLAMAHMSSTANNRVVNAPLHYAEVVNLLGFFAILITTGIFADAATRDASTGTQALFSTAPISKADYLAGRFAASFLVNAALLLGPPLAVALSTQLPWLDHFNWAPFRVAAFAQPYVLFALPNLLISAAVIFTIAVLTRQALATYLGGLGLIVLYLVVANNNWGPPTVDILADPFGLIALERVTRFWPPAEQTTRLLGFPGLLLANRAIWLALAAGLLVFAYRRFDFGHAGVGGRRRSARGPAGAREVGGEAEEPMRHAIALIPHAVRDFGVRTHVVQMLAVARHSLADIMRNRVFLLVVAGAVFLVFAFGWEAGAIVFDTSSWPVTHLIAGAVLTIPMAIVFTVLTSLVAGELVWKEREVGAGDIAAAAPIPDWVPLAGRFIALVAILVMLQAVLMAAGVTLQAIQGYYRFELGLYVKILFGLNLADYLIFAALAMAVHVVVNHKNLAHMVVVATYLFTLTAAAFLGVRHNLLLYNGDPGWTYSDLNGFGPFVGPFVWFKTYWAAWALLLTVTATVFWVRSTEGGLRGRLRLAHLRLAGAAGRAAAVAGLLILTLGGFVFYNTNVLNEYRTPAEVARVRADYERTYKKYEQAPQPTVTRNELRVEIYPERPAVDIRGTYRLLNASGKPVDTVLVLVDDEVTLRSLEFDRPATLVVDDAATRQRIYVLSQSLQPGDSMSLRFNTAFERRGFPNGGIPTAVVENGAYFDRGWLPMIGYRASWELTDERVRKDHGLPPRAEAPSPSDTSARARRYRATDRDMELVDMDVVIGTAPDQIAVTPGKLVREWRERGRRYFQYRTERPISHGAPFLSARYTVRENAWKDVALKVFYHPTHTFNLDRIVNSMKASLEYYSTHFGPYPYSELRVVEFPRYASFARAHPHTIAFSEGSAFITRIEEGDVDRPFFVVAHETAHQWWGNQLRGARVKGAALLSETLAQYSAMMVMEKTYGADMARRFYDFEMERYLRGRASFSRREVPMVEAMSQRHLFYHKGAVVMYTMREMIGEEPLSLALRRFYTKHAGRTLPYPTSLDLIAELRAVTPDSLQPLITDLFETITLWEVKTDSATAERVGDEWRVALTVMAKKVRADSIGKETEVPMNDLVEVGVFADAKAGERPGKPLYLRKHRVRNGRQTIVVTVPVDFGAAPVRAGVDPYDKLIVRERQGTVVTVRARGGS